MKSIPGSSLNSLGVDLGGLNQSLKNHPLNSSKDPLKEPKGIYRIPKDFTYRPITLLYPPLKPVTPNDLSYEIFMELINKTDFLLRKLVASLELKQKTDKAKLF